MMFKPSFFGLLLVGVLAMSCATPPPPVPDTPPPPPPVDTAPPPPPPVDTPPPPPPPPVDVPNDDPLGLNAPFSEAEVAEVEAALAAARQAGADRWAPDLLNQASETFEQAKVLGSTNRAADGRPLLAQALAQANAARDAAFAARLGQARQRLADARQSAVDRRADRWDPQGFARAEETARPVTDLLNAQDVSGSEGAVDRAVAAYAALIRQIEERLGALERLQTSVDLQLAEAESLEAFIWVPELLEGAQDAALRGAVARGRFNLDASEESYNEALFLTGRALREVRVQKARRETEDLMLETMRQIEAASRRMILQDDQTVREGQPWTGEPFLNRPAAPVPTEDRNSQAWPADGVIAVAAETVVVAADDLERAKQLWLQGVLEKDAGNFAQANALFLEAQRFIQMYLAKAVDKFYTVRLIPERRDSLWRIAEYPEIYGTPWDWPRIWRANRRLIENPDLIYPGWQLVIPPR